MTGETESKFRVGIDGVDGDIGSNVSAIRSRAAAILFSTTNLSLSISSFALLSSNSCSHADSLTFSVNIRKNKNFVKLNFC